MDQQADDNKPEEEAPVEQQQDEQKPDENVNDVSKDDLDDAENINVEPPSSEPPAQEEPEEPARDDLEKSELHVKADKKSAADPFEKTLIFEESRLDVGYTCKHGWYELRPHGKLPEKRSHHSSVIYNGSIYVYGGEDSREGKYDSLWKLDLDAFIEIGDKIQEDQTEEEAKNMTHQNDDDKRLQWELISTTGTKPGAISYHKAVVKDDNMYLFGGMRGDGECNGELYILNLTTYEWTIDPTQEGRPEPRDDISMD